MSQRDGGGWLHGVVALHGRVHQLGAAKVVVPVEDVDDEVAQGKHNSGTIILSQSISSDASLQSLFPLHLQK